MASEELLRQALADKLSAVEAQGNSVRALKASKAPKSDIDAAIQALNALKLEKTSLERDLQATVTGTGADGSVSREEFRQLVSNTLERRLFYIPSFKIYRGVAGLYDYGPPGCAVKSNVLSFWRQHFVLEENMLEVDCPCVTPEVVLKASGHVDKFTDLMVKDEKTGTCYRADHLLKDFCSEKLQKDLSITAKEAAELKRILAVLDDLSAEELGAKLKEYGITAPDTKNPLSDPYPFNLMFQTSIGPSGLSPGFMRPETAQGIFVNFKDLYYYNGNKLPFAAAQIGQAFRNEVKLVKCLVQNIVVDISFNQLGGLCTLCFLEQVDCLISKDHLFKRSIILIKAWCYYESRILGAHHGLISTYAMETLVLYIFHLFNSSLNGPLAVLYKFLDYFSNFDWDNYCISLNGPVRISSLPELMSETPENAGHDLLLTDDFLKGCVEMFSAPSRGYETSSRTFPQKHLNIVDPLKENNNLGRSVSKGNFFRIRSAFTYGARKLGRILSQPEENIGDEIRKFFSNTLERHGKGQRPDVQDSFHMSGHDEFSAASFSDAELQEIQRGYEAESSSMTGEYRLNHERSLLPGGDPDVEISGTEVMTERYVGEQYENSSNVMPSMDLSKPENSSDGTAVSDNSLHGDAQDLAMSRFQSLTISNDSPKSSPTRHAPHLYFLHSPIANEETNGNCQVRQQKNSGSTENTAGDQDEHQFVSNHKIMSPVGSKQHLSRLSSIVLSSEDFYPSSSSYRLSTAIAGSPEPFNTLSDLNGDFESHLNSLHYGRWCYDCALNASIPPMASMVSQFHGKKSWDVIRRSLHLKHNVFSQMNTNGVVHRPAFYPINSPLLPGGVGFGVEEMQKPRGTGTYFPNMNHYRDRPMTPRGRNQVPVRSPRNNNRMVTVGTESGLLERSGRDTAQAQISTHKVNGKSVSADDLSGSPRRKVNTNNANGSMHPSERFVEFGSMGHPPPEAPLPRGSWQTNSGLSPVQNSDTSLNSPASDKLKPVLSMDKDRIAVKSYHLKDDDDFPPLSV